MLLVAPEDVEASVPFFALPDSSIGENDQVREQDPRLDVLSAVGIAGHLKCLLLPGPEWCIPIPEIVEWAAAEERSNQVVVHDTHAAEWFCSDVLYTYVKFSLWLPEICGLELNRTGALLRLVDGVSCHHAAFHVLGDVAVEQPSSRVVGLHVGDGHAARHELDHVRVTIAVSHDPAVPVGRVQVNLITHAEQIPANTLSLLHHKSGEVAEDISVNRVIQTVGLAAELVEDHKQGHEFAIDIFGRAVGPRFAFGSDDDRAEKAGVGFDGLVGAAVIPPDERTWIGFPGAARLIRKPVIGEPPARAHG